MTRSRIPQIGGILTAALLLLGVLGAFQTGNPAVIFQAVTLAFYVWLVLGIVFVVRHGVPVRTVGDAREPHVTLAEGKPDAKTPASKGMPRSRAFMAGLVATAVFLGVAVLFFFQYKDPMILIFGLLSILMMWAVLLIVHVMRRGIPVRVVDDERKP